MTDKKEYTSRIYRAYMGNARLKSFRAEHLETDLWIAVSAKNYTPSVEYFSQQRIAFYRNILEEHIRDYPDFLESLTPLIPLAGSHKIILEMYEASAASGTGPMSAVAGAVAEWVCNDIAREFGFEEIVVENGGDIFMKLSEPSTVSVYAGESPLSGKIGLIIQPEDTPLSVCCSSATVGHSLSFGSADACVIVCRSGALADAYATACCNAVTDTRIIHRITGKFMKKAGVLSVLIIKDDKVGMGGEIEITIL